MNDRTNPSSPPDILSEPRISLYRMSRPLGDALFLTTAAHEIRKRRPDMEITIHSHWPLLFLNNPDISSFQGIQEPQVPSGHEISYEKSWPPRERRHVLQIVCEDLGFDPDSVEPRIYYNPTDAEREHAREICPPAERPLVVVHPFSGFFAARTKQWDFGNWKSFLDLIPDSIDTMRFCNPDEPATPSEREPHRDIETSDIRLMAALLERADAFVGQESGLAHLATALGVPSVVIFTGYVPPEVFGYPQNINLVPENLDYIPCWQGDGCDPCKGEVCTKAVSPERALEALQGLLRNQKKIS